MIKGLLAVLLFWIILLVSVAVLGGYVWWLSLDIKHFFESILFACGIFIIWFLIFISIDIYHKHKS